ncbi:MAG: beta-ketoacyl-[acyl-carrier-protein] synthase family protein, partial [Planctomycetota bacterium]
MNSSFRVAITGLGIFSCLGSSLHEVKEALLQGKSGIGLDRNREKIGFRSSLTGILPKPNLKEMGLHRKELRTMDEPAQYAYIAAKMALENAGLSLKDIQNPRWGIVFGNDSTVKPTVEALDILRKDKETRFIGSGYIFRSMNSTVTMNLAVLLGIEGASWTLSSACASGAHAIGQGVMLIRSGLQDGVLVGGAQEVNIESMASFDALGAFSTRMDEPQKASRPFDAHRDGLVPSGGGACLVLENWEKAKKRGAPIYAAIEGYGFSTRSGKHLS